MSLSAKDIQARFAETAGQDPLFAPVDGANCPSASPGNASDHSLLLKHGLIRIFLPVPVNAQFTVSVVHDPYGCAMVPGPNGGQPIVSVYRRPLPTTNLDLTLLRRLWFGRAREDYGGLVFARPVTARERPAWSSVHGRLRTSRIYSRCRLSRSRKRL